MYIYNQTRGGVVDAAKMQKQIEKNIKNHGFLINFDDFHDFGGAEGAPPGTSLYIK